MPEPLDAGNVLRPFTTLSLSFRLPPTAGATAALEQLKQALTTDVPYGAQVELTRSDLADGWDAPELAPWLRTTLDDVSTTVFDAPWGTVGLGGSIPFMGLLATTYPAAQFLVTGAVGSDSNIHVPDEWLHLSQAARVTSTPPCPPLLTHRPQQEITQPGNGNRNTPSFIVGVRQKRGNSSLLGWW
ncbi:acetylornithine deacetylase/succinyl-diaminopimelate desuccinylase-like protein [Kibdelosporangium phytohabitans]|uniref:Peptidase M20 dimerisation domain-containing protein n=1 Tax=Kibdelosporangium phytohabitans TaxID=860235 RepID=A0A0N9HZU3_9PSEU|nr:hypothetical protein AOZ06_13260 [Kibdelosporangium phytohabitans]MBE1471344.1 acetylornithine deacetylase/succinyl-diaminopimelate desuccinylase-like protein [Kibdelosporangium phytohabitans]